jgi:molybdopterin-guanine dinucleotide biosynthesis protein A
LIAIGVVILAGGEATRLPGKLALDAGSVPMIARVYGNVSPGRTTFVSCKETFAPEIDALLPCPMVVDRWALRGPLSGLITTMSVMTSPYVFAVAGDAPFVDAAFIDRLAGEFRAGDQALVPQHRVDNEARIEPLAAIYDRIAFINAGLPILRSGKGALRAVIEKLNSRYINVQDDAVFANVNTPQDYQHFQEAHTA